ncbi:MAG: hypothetical protein LBO63_04800 [Oscillospiraceae bacterium]|jgi:hypothetical protein|nr:hypothetical protein [Oscillospiraceae bacterium]
MKNIKKFKITVIIAVTAVSVLIVSTIGCVFGFQSGGKDYNAARGASVALFVRQSDKFEEVRNWCLKNESAPTDIIIKKVESIYYNKTKTVQIVEFEIGYQGLLMTGGQGWGIYFVSNDMPLQNGAAAELPMFNGPYEGSYYWRYEKSSAFYVTERIAPNWFFYYMDYDGNKHGLDWENNNLSATTNKR